ncbi:MAG: methionine--tRNA ligase, partial [Terriglobales bacterium]
MAEKFYITTPIYYVNARPHIGHAYTTIACDAIARRQRMLGSDTFFLTGTDEHGQKIERSAAEAGITPKQLTDRIAGEFRGLWDRMNISYDDFIRTTDERHKRGVQEMFRRIRDNGYIYKGSYSGQYCVFDELYVDAATPGAPCPECGRPTETVSEENYFFKLSAFEDKLLKLYTEQPNFIRPETRRNEVMAFVRSGLRDLSISRTSIQWGIPVPDDPRHVIYVWLDALSNYCTAIGFGSPDPKDQQKFAHYWPADVHMIGKEIVRFHCVYWPAFLMAVDEKLPKGVFAHGWLLFDQQKMSKSKGNVAYPEPIARTVGVDALRYYLLREVPFGRDGNFSHDALITRYNSDLANGLGNAANRVLTMIANYCGGEIPRYHEQNPTHDPNVMEIWKRTVKTIVDLYDTLDFFGALEKIWGVIAELDGFLTLKRPWQLAGEPTQREELENVLYDAAETIRLVTALAHPVLPNATFKLWNQLGQPGALAEVRIDELEWGGLRPGTRIGEFSAVFPRVEKSEVLEKIAAMEEEIKSPNAAPSTTPATTPVPGHPAASQGAAAATAPAPAAVAGPVKIGIDDFAKVEMRVGQ